MGCWFVSVCEKTEFAIDSIFVWLDASVDLECWCGVLNFWSVFMKLTNEFWKRLQNGPMCGQGYKFWQSAVYICANSSTLAAQIAYIESCTQRVHDWLLNTGLHLNPSKSEGWGHCFLKLKVKTARCFGRVCSDHHSCGVFYQTPVIYKKSRCSPKLSYVFR